MKPLTCEWVQKAEADWITAQREWRARNNPNYDAACFHAQQCAEKYLKARLQESNIRFGRTHNLVALMELLLPAEPNWESLRLDLQALNVFAVEFRYPGESASKDVAQEAVKRCKNIRQCIRQSLGLAG